MFGAETKNPYPWSVREVIWLEEWTERFDDRILRTEDHWWWTGYRDRDDGYGRFKPTHNLSAQLAHRVAYTRWVGRIPDGYDVDHVGHVFAQRHCVRPDHLEAVPHRENIRRGNSLAGRNARLTHCPRCGDPLDDPKFATQRANGERRCLRCQRAEHARYRARKRAAPTA